MKAPLSSRTSPLDEARLMKNYVRFMFFYVLMPITPSFYFLEKIVSPLIAWAIVNLLFGTAIYLFPKKDAFLFPLWEIKENIRCVDCGKTCKGFRLVKSANYDRTKDKEPEFRCEDCSKNKLEELRQRGVKI